MLSFENDYGQGCHPEVLRHLTETNMETLTGYGQDIYTERAAEKIRAACGAPEADVYFTAGGTQTNQLVIDTMLPGYAAAIAAVSGHIATHEAGAIEYTGHKVITLPEHLGKLDAGELEAYLADLFANNGYAQLVVPRLVYLSWPTEYGTLYSKAELEAVRATADRYGLKVFIDGARLGYGLAAEGCNLTLPELARLCDAFYIGGTKCGALCGEAIVFPHGAPDGFYASMKQHGAMPAKGRLFGVQFDALFTDGLYERIGTHAIGMAKLLKEAFLRKGYRQWIDSPTNQQFFIMTREKMEAINKKAKLLYWETLPDGNVVVRFTVSWATEEDDIKVLEALI